MSDVVLLIGLIAFALWLQVQHVHLLSELERTEAMLRVIMDELDLLDEWDAGRARLDAGVSVGWEDAGE